MPKKKLRKFIDKKDCVNFHLGYRSQKDPLITDASAPQRILIPANNSKEVLHMTNGNKNTKEQLKYGIFFDDDYNYLENVRDINILSCQLEEMNVLNENMERFVENKNLKINLPSSVFESNIEEKVGLLNKLIQDTGLHLDLDADIVAALDDDFDFENPDNVLEDNFIELANVNNVELNFNKNVSLYNGQLSKENLILLNEEKDAFNNFISNQYKFNEIETSSDFTGYSISSNVIRRNKQLIVLDDMFEKVSTDYSENEIGALDYQYIEGHLESNSDLLKFFEDVNKDQLQSTEPAKLVRRNMKIDDHKEDNSLSETIIVECRYKRNWDCESILTTNSNIYNHPKLIHESQCLRIQTNKKSSIPRSRSEISTHKYSSTETKLCALESNFASFHSRPLPESLREKKDRKLAVKNYRKERRQERKLNIDAFKNEKKRQEQISFNKKRSCQGTRIS